MKINTHFQELLLDKTRFLFMVGGAGSGKSRFAAEKILLRMMGRVEEVMGLPRPKGLKPERFLIVRKVKDTCAVSVYQLFKDIISEEGWDDLFDISKSEQKIIYLGTEEDVRGSSLRCVGLDDPEKIKSITGITSIWYEEATESEEQDILQLNLRMRGAVPTYKQLMLTFNPIDELHWLKKYIEDNEGPKLKLHSSTFLDNAFLEPDDRDELLTRYSTNRKMYDVYVLGQWGKVQTGGEFYRNFDRTIHVKPCLYNSELPLCISFDENTKPYLPGVVFQTELVNGYWECRMIDLILGISPNNSTSWMSREISRKYRLHVAGMFIYGDSTSREDDVKQEKGVDFFQLIMNGLEQFHPQRRIANRNPNVKARGNWINDMMAGNPLAGNIKFMINTSMKEAINDYYFTKEDFEGKKDKMMVRDKKTGERYQPHGHITDAADYFLCERFQKEYNEWQYGGKGHKILFMPRRKMFA
jgi:hypothetical protein